MVHRQVHRLSVVDADAVDWFRGLPIGQHERYGFAGELGDVLFIDHAQQDYAIHPQDNVPGRDGHGVFARGTQCYDLHVDLLDVGGGDDPDEDLVQIVGLQQVHPRGRVNQADLAEFAAARGQLANECPFAVQQLHRAFVRQVTHHALDGPYGDAKVRRELAVGWQLLPDLVPARQDHPLNGVLGVAARGIFSGMANKPHDSLRRACAN